MRLILTATVLANRRVVLFSGAAASEGNRNSRMAAAASIKGLHGKTQPLKEASSFGE
jgi:hypothetical protein